MKIDIKKSFQLHLAPTIGISPFEELIISTETINKIRYRTFEPNVVYKPFLLTKFQLITTLAPIDLALGGEFRQVYKQKTFYALYLGATISLDKLKK